MKRIILLLVSLVFIFGFDYSTGPRQQPEFGFGYKATRGAENILTTRYGIDSSLFSNLVLLVDQGYTPSKGTLSTWADVSGRANNIKQDTGSNQPAVSTLYRSLTVDDFMHQEVFDTNQGVMTFVADGGTAEFRDASQNFAEWETTTRDATHQIIITTDNGTSYGYLGASNNAGKDIDIYSDVALTTRGWQGRATPQASPDTAASYEVREVDFSLINDFTIIAVIKLDDGQPASDNGIVGKSDSDAGIAHRQIFFSVETDGKLRLILSAAGGWEASDILSDDSQFTNDAQSDYAVVAVTKSGTSAVLYKNGVALAATTGVGGIPAVLFDSPEQLTVGCKFANTNPTNFFNGRIPSIIILATGLTGTQILNNFNAVGGRYGL